MNFDPTEGHWFVYEPTRDGMLSMRVHDDGTPLLMPQEVEVTADSEVVN